LVALAGVLGLAVSQWSSALIHMATSTSKGRFPSAWKPIHRARVHYGAHISDYLMFGLAPALRSTGVDLTGTLKSGSRSVSGNARPPAVWW
jgi:hypothetical protein